MKKLLLIVFLAGCAQAPTKAVNSVGGDSNPVVLADTRSPLDYNSFHVKGSINLNTADFLILKNPKTKLRILDPDLTQTVERLAKKGISPFKTVLLISETENDLEGKKWNWLLRQLGVTDVKMSTLAQFRVINSHLRPQPEPPRMPAWEIKDPRIILENSQKCFVEWSETGCVQQTD